MIQIATLPPIVAVAEIDQLCAALAECAEGHRVLIQGGDCAERFSDCRLEQIAKKIKILLQMSFVVTYGAKTPTVRIGMVGF